MKKGWVACGLLPIVTLAACSSSSDSPSPSSTRGTESSAVETTATVTQSVTVSATPSSGAATATGSATASPDSRCSASALSLARAGSNGAGGTEYLTFTLTNTGQSTCTLFGYPGVSVVDAAGATVQHPAKRGQTGTLTVPAPKTVTLNPGRRGYFLLTSVNVIPNPECTKAFTGRRLRVYPPDSTKALTITFTDRFCDLGVGPMTAKSS